MTRDAQFGPKELVEPNDAAIQDTYYSACETARKESAMMSEAEQGDLIVKLLAQLAKVEAERDAYITGLQDAKAALAWFKKALEEANALAADMRERCAKRVEDRFGKDAAWAIAAAIRSLSYPTTEPAKAEGRDV